MPDFLNDSITTALRHLNLSVENIFNSLHQGRTICFGVINTYKPLPYRLGNILETVQYGLWMETHQMIDFHESHGDIRLESLYHDYRFMARQQNTALLINLS